MEETVEVVNKIIATPEDLKLRIAECYFYGYLKEDRDQKIAEKVQTIDLNKFRFFERGNGKIVFEIFVDENSDIRDIREWNFCHGLLDDCEELRNCLSELGFTVYSVLDFRETHKNASKLYRTKRETGELFNIDRERREKSKNPSEVESTEEAPQEKE